MRSKGLIAVVALVACALVASAAYAASPHFKRGGTPTCKDTGELLVCTGTLAGLGNEDLVIAVTSDAAATFNCVNKGGNAAPGQNKVLFSATGSKTITGGEIKNGNATFSVVAPTEPPTATPEQAGCPNGKTWSAVRVGDIDFSNVVLTISQGGLLFTCRYPGEVPEGRTVTLTCQ